MNKNKLPETKIKLNFSQVFTKFKQFVFLSVKTSGYNNLWESAASCSYSFLFSVIPVVLIILTILINILKVSPDVLQSVIDFCSRFSNFYDFTPLIENLMNKKSISFIDIFLGFWVIWMARKMFMSIIQAMYRIFRSKTKRLSIFNQVLTFISEFVLVILFIVLMLFAFMFNKFLQLPVFVTIRNSFPSIFRASSNVIVSSVMYLMIFLITLYFYKFVSGTNPRWIISIFYAAISTGVTFVISFFINKFMHFVNYNIIYGTISTLLIFLFKIYMFFGVFLFCAQMVFVSQFFEELIIAQLYTMQKSETNPASAWWNQKFFGRPSVYKLETYSKTFASGDEIYKEGEKSNFVYFIKRGKVEEKNENFVKIHETSDFFGEISGILNMQRETFAVALEDTEVLVFDTELFLSLIQKSKQASAMLLERVNKFTGE